MRRFISLSGPLGGFYCGEISTCFGIGRLPQEVMNLLTHIEYTDAGQTIVGPAQYWRDPYNLESYVAGCKMLPRLDNLKEINETIRTNFMSVDKIILFGSSRDGTISPW